MGLPSPPDAQHPRRRYMSAVLTEDLHSQQQHALTLDVTAGMLLLTLLGLTIMKDYNLVCKCGDKLGESNQPPLSSQ